MVDELVLLSFHSACGDLTGCITLCSYDCVMALLLSDTCRRWIHVSKLRVRNLDQKGMCVSDVCLCVSAPFTDEKIAALILQRPWGILAHRSLYFLMLYEDRLCVCVCPCIVARQIYSSTWLTSDISVSSPLSCHHCAASFSPATQGKTTRPDTLSTLETCSCPYLLRHSPPHPSYCCIFTAALNWGYLWPIMRATYKHSSLSLVSAKACRVGPGIHNNRPLC